MLVIRAQILELWKASLTGPRRIIYTIKGKKADPSSIVEVSFGDVIMWTGVAENTTSPEWNESFLMFVTIFWQVYIILIYGHIHSSDRVPINHRVLSLSLKSKSMILVLEKLK